MSADARAASNVQQVARARILLIINSLDGGGAERVMATLLANSAEWLERHDVALALLDRKPRAFALPAGIEIIQLDCKGRTWTSVAAVARLVRDHAPDVTMSFLTRSNLASGLAMMRRRRPWIVSERTSTPAHLGSGSRQLATKLLMRLVYPRASRLIAVSAGIAGKLSRSFGVRPERISVVANPVDIEPLRNSSSEPLDQALERELDTPFVIAVGRLVKVKNYALLLRGFARSHLDAKLVIAGDGPEREALSTLARELGIAERLVLPGWLSNPYPAVSRAALFALSSDVEGFPNALVEALALNIPAVATNCHDGPAEILAGKGADQLSGLTVTAAGILTPVRDVASFADALRLAFAQPQRDSMAIAAGERAKEYSAAQIAAVYWSIIEAELERARHARSRRRRAAGRRSS